MNESTEQTEPARPTVRLHGPESIRRHLLAAIPRPERGLLAVRFVICDETNRVLLHCPVEGEPAPRTMPDCRHTVGVFAHVIGFSGAAMVVALTRPGPAAVTELERIWFRAAHQECAEHEVRLLGVHLLTPLGHRELLPDDAA